MLFLRNILRCNAFAIADTINIPSILQNKRKNKTKGKKIDKKNTNKNQNQNKNQKEAGGLFVLTSFFNHSDQHNAGAVPAGYFIFIFANQNIKKGSEITISYCIGDDQIDPTGFSGAHRLQHWNIQRI